MAVRGFGPCAKASIIGLSRRIRSVIGEVKFFAYLIQRLVVQRGSAVPYMVLGTSIDGWTFIEISLCTLYFCRT